MLEFAKFKNLIWEAAAMHSLPKSLPDFSLANILVIGDVMLDRYWFGDTSRISPEAPVPIVKINNKDNRPGGAANVALNIASLGAHVRLLGITGRDEAAQTLMDQLDEASVQHDFQTLDGLSTIIKLRVISRHQQLIRLDFEEKLPSSHHNDLIEKFKKHLSLSQLVILSDYKKGTLHEPKMFIQLARAANIPVLVDPKGSDFTIYKHATIITPNFKEFEVVVGSCPNEEILQQKAKNLLTELDIEALLITRGEAGMTLIRADETVHLPAYAREVFDVTGAGDTVIGVLGAALAAHLDIIAAMSLANLAASLVVSKLGAATVSAPELETALTGKPNLATGIMNEDQLFLAVNAARSAGKKIVFTNGCFDILHAGHVTYLQMAKTLGDYLIVAVNADESIRKIKGNNRPINNLDHRMTVLAGLEMVDWVVPFKDETPERLLKFLQPDLLVKGGDYHLDQVVGADIVRAYGGEVRIMHHNIKTSSTRLLNALQNNDEASEVLNHA